MIDLTTCCPIVGTEYALTSECVIDWGGVTAQIPSGDTCTFSVNHNGFDYSGIIAMAADNLALLVVFDQTDVMLPSGVCFYLDCSQDIDLPDELPDYCNKTVGVLTDDTKLAILDDDGCPAGYILFSTLKADIIAAAKADLNFCDFFPTGIPEGDLVVSDRVLTTTGTCALKSVPMSDITCD